MDEEGVTSTLYNEHGNDLHKKRKREYNNNPYTQRKKWCQLRVAFVVTDMLLRSFYIYFYLLILTPFIYTVVIPGYTNTSSGNKESFVLN